MGIEFLHISCQTWHTNALHFCTHIQQCPEMKTSEAAHGEMKGELKMSWERGTSLELIAYNAH